MKKFLSALPPYTLSALTVAAILYLTLVPKPLPDTEFEMPPGTDKVIHALMFGGLCFMLMLDMTLRHHPLTRRVLTVTVTAVCLFGGVIEIIQQAMAMGRGGDCYDWIADIAGTLLAVPVGLWIIKKFKITV